MDAGESSVAGETAQSMEMIAGRDRRQRKNGAWKRTAAEKAEKSRGKGGGGMRGEGGRICASATESVRGRQRPIPTSTSESDAKGRHRVAASRGMPSPCPRTDRTDSGALLNGVPPPLSMPHDEWLTRGRWLQPLLSQSVDFAPSLLFKSVDRKAILPNLARGFAHGSIDAPLRFQL